MDLPQPPQDTDLRNIIDKLAQFVARNGPEFEQMTKSKQKNNPKFSFLYGGEFFNYYQYKVTTEQAILKQSSGQREEIGYAGQGGGFSGGEGWSRGSDPPPAAPSVPPATPLLAPTLSPAVIIINSQQAALNKQIQQSQGNLNAQHSSLKQQQHSQVEETVVAAQNEMIQHLAAKCNISLTEFDSILQPIIESCTKDSISTGKGWILTHATNHDAGTVVSQYLLKKLTTTGSTFTQKLHIIYLVNDVLHHCARKNADDLKKNLENVVVPMFCNASIAITEEQETKLNKLLKLWESKSNYFDSSVIEKMKNPTTSYQEYQANLISQYENLITPHKQQTKATFESYQKQHQAFVAHTLQQIQQLELQKQVLINAGSQMSITSQMPPDQSNSVTQLNIIPNQIQQQQHFGSNNFPEQNFNQQAGQFQNNQQSSFEQQDFCNTNQPLFPMIDQANTNYGTPNGSQGSNNENNLNDFEQNYNHNVSSNSTSNEHGDEPAPAIPPVNLSLPPPGFFNEKIPVSFENGLPDLSKPPPGFANIPEVCPEDLMPSVPYFELPAGLMVPLIMLEDCEYKSLDPDSIRLPPPAPPSDRLLAAVKAFYAKPNHTRPQDSEGWEKLGLYEYYRAKNAVRKQKEEDIKNGLREKSRSPTPIKYDILNVRSPPARRYRSKSRSPSRERSVSKSPPLARTMSPDRSSVRRSRISRRSPTPPSSSPPPSFMTPSFGNPNELSELDPSNKGHQMLRRMGWGQGGLGSSGQGIASPINAGAVRDRQDQYKGVGVNLNDPYENFRKNKGAAFITRMKERALERA